MSDNSRVWNLRLQVDTSQAKQDFSELRGLSDEIRKDWEAISSSVQDTIGRANDLNSVLSDIRDASQSILDLQRETQTYIQSNKQDLKDTLESIREVVTQQSRMGGAGGGGYGGGGGGGGGFGGMQMGTAFGTDIFGNRVNNAGIVSNPDLANTVGARNPNSFIARMFRGGRRRHGYGRGGHGGYGGYGGGGYGGGGGPHGPNDDEFDDEFDEEDPLGRYSGLGGVHRGPTPVVSPQFKPVWLDQIPRYLRQRYSNSPKQMSDPAMSVLDELSRASQYLPGGGTATSVLKKLGGIVKQQQEESGSYQTITDVNGVKSRVRVNNELTPLEQTITRVAGKGNMLEVIGSLAKFGAAVSAVTEVVTGAYTVARAVMAPVQALIGQAQQQGSLTGQVSYGSTLQQGWQAQYLSGFGFNPFYSAADVAAAQQQAMIMGMKPGSSMQGNYITQALNLQQSYGMSQQEIGQVVSAGLAAGIGVNTTASNLQTVNNIAANSNLTSAPTAIGTYTAAASTAGLGGFNATQAGAAGTLASLFIAGNPILQSMHATGQEFAQTQVGQALVGQSLGVGYMGVAGAEMSGKFTSTEFIQKTGMSLITLLGNATGGVVNPNATKDQIINGQGGMTPSIIQNVMQGIGMGNMAQNPQAAVNYVLGQIQQVQRTSPAALNRNKQLLHSKWGMLNSSLRNILANQRDWVSGEGRNVGVNFGKWHGSYDAFERIFGSSNARRALESGAAKLTGLTGDKGKPETLADYAAQGRFNNAVNGGEATWASGQKFVTPSQIGSMTALGASQAGNVTITLDLTPTAKSLFKGSAKVRNEVATGKSSANQLPPNLALMTS